MALQADEKIIIGGTFEPSSGFNRNNVARLNPNGSLDRTFFVGSGTGDAGVEAVALDANGDVLIGGVFDVVNCLPRRFIARLHGQ